MVRTVSFLFFSACVVVCSTSNALNTTNLLPQPQIAESRFGEFTFDPAQLRCLLTADSDEAVTRLKARLSESLDVLGIESGASTVTTRTDQPFALTLGSRFLTVPQQNVRFPKEAQAEGYELIVSDSAITLRADSEVGLFYGMMTLEQILTAALLENEPRVPCVRILDWPAIEMRGYSEDYGRNQLPTLEDHKRSIRTFARFKMNTYLFFIESDHFEYTFDPDLGKAVDRFTFDELRELVRYAKQYHVEIIPTVELLGHMEETLKHPQYKHLAEIEGGMDLCSTCDDSFELVTKMVNEIAPAFDSPYFHAGLDESFQIGEGRSKEIVERVGIETVIANYYKRMRNLLASHGKTMMMYADIALKYPGCLRELPKDINMMFWEYTPRDHYKDIDTLHDAGFPVTTLSAMRDWHNLYPVYALAFPNMEVMAKQTYETGSMGHFVSSWGDGYRGVAGANLSEMNGYGVVYCSALSWNPSPIPFAEYSDAYALHFFGADDPELSSALTLLAQCQGKQHGRARRFFQSELAVSVGQMVGTDEPAMAYWRKLRADSHAAHVYLTGLTPPRNADTLRVIDLSARMLNFSADMALLCQSLAEGLDKNPDMNTEVYSHQFEALTERYEQLWRDYVEAYRATNRPLNLGPIDELWSWMHDQLDSTAHLLYFDEFSPKKK